MCISGTVIHVAARANTGATASAPLLSVFWITPSLTRALISASADGLFRPVQGDIERVLFDGPAIHKRLEEMAAQITPIIPNAN
jgi:hypothetical protein